MRHKTGFMFAASTLFRVFGLVGLATLVGISLGPCFAQKNDAEPRTVKVDVWVTDKSGRPVSGLSREDFLLVENGKSIPSTAFSVEERPIDVGLLIDATGSMRPVLADCIEAARKIIRTLKPGDNAFLARIRDAKVEILVDWTADKTELLAPLAATDGRGRGSIIDSLYFAGEHLAAHRADVAGPSRRRALIVITDGQDNDSTHNENQLQKFLNGDKIQVLAIGLNSGKARSDALFMDAQQKAEGLLRSLTSDTGGFLLLRTPNSDLKHAAENLLNFQRLTYAIRYSPSVGQPADKVKVKLVEKPGRSKYTVTAKVIAR